MAKYIKTTPDWLEEVERIGTELNGKCHEWEVRNNEVNIYELDDLKERLRVAVVKLYCCQQKPEPEE